MGLRYKCKNCNEKVHCCIFKNNKGFTFVGIIDAKRIKRLTGKKYTDFLGYSPLPKRVVDTLCDYDPSSEGALRHAQLDKKNRLLRLNTKKDGKCIFLDDSKKCEIYNIRPNICRIYPFWAIKLLNGRIKIVTHDYPPDCPSIVNMNKDKIEKKLSKKEILEIKKVFRRILKENKYYLKNINKFAKQNRLY